jgi:hypothetical protein
MSNIENSVLKLSIECSEEPLQNKALTVVLLIRVLNLLRTLATAHPEIIPFVDEKLEGILK